MPDPQDPATFERSKLDWSELGKPGHAEMLDLHRRLIALRRTTPGLTDPWLSDVEVWHGDQHVVIRRGTHVVAANLADRPQTVSIRSTVRSVLLATSPGVVVERDRLVLPPETAAVVSVDICHLRRIGRLILACREPHSPRRTRRVTREPVLRVPS